MTSDTPTLPDDQGPDHDMRAFVLSLYGCPRCRARPGASCIGRGGKKRLALHLQRWEVARIKRYYRAKPERFCITPADLERREAAIRRGIARRLADKA